MATETKKLSKLDSILNKIDAFFENLMSSKKEGDDLEEDDDMEGKKADDDEESKKADKSAKKSKKATDEEDSQDPDDDDDDDSTDEGDDDDDKDDVYGKSAKSEIAKRDAIIAKQNKLLKEAQAALAERDEDVRETIKSTFKPQGSQRSTKTAVKTEAPAFAQPVSDLAKRAAKLASNQRR